MVSSSMNLSIIRNDAFWYFDTPEVGDKYEILK